MRAIYRMFLLRMLQTSAKILLGCFLGAVVAHRLGYDFVAFVLGGIFFVSAFQGIGLVGGHLNMLLGFPYSRRRLVLFTVAVNWAAMALAGASLLTYSVFLGFLLDARGPAAAARGFRKDL
jgi:hypothetical protein